MSYLISSISAYPDEVFNKTELIGEWGKDLVLPCRYAPGPLAHDSANFYQHTWTSVLDGQFSPISSNNNFQDSNSDFTLTIVKLNPILALYDYQCGIEFANNAPLQPYMLKNSSDVEAIDVMINEIDGQCI